ncbi:MAG: glycerophosphodiester phosphodiesterase family protein [Bacteroidota bacterium]
MINQYWVYYGIIPLAFLCICCFSYSHKTKSNSINPDFTITSHRGFSGEYPENTLVAIEKALELGVDRIEIDVHQTKDSVLVLMHDKSINRTTNGKGKVKDLTYAALQSFSAGITTNVDFVAEKIPTLSQVLDLVQGKSTLVIEIKEGHDYYPNIEQRIVDLVAQKRANEWCIIHSFKTEVLEKVHALDSTLVLHQLLLSTLLYDVAATPVYISELSVYHRAITAGVVDKVHQEQKKINAWTVNDTAKVQRLLQIGVDGIITDYPDLVQGLQ